MKAFPQLDSETYDQFRDKGMDLRDYFAAKAMHATILNNRGPFSGTQEEFARNISVSAYLMADAMMKAREVD